MTDALSQNKSGRFNKKDIHWKASRLLAFYRLLLACTFISVFLFFPSYTQLGLTWSKVFIASAYIYAVYAFASLLMVSYRRPDFKLQIYLNAFVDIAIVLICLYTSGGLGSGLGVLLIVTISSLGFFASVRIALAFAAGTALLLLIGHVYQVLRFEVPSSDSLQAGLLGAGLFVVAYVSSLLARQLSESRALAEQQEIDLANLGQLNEHIIQHLESGMLVVDSQNRIRLINEAGVNLLSLTGDSVMLMLSSVSVELSDQLRQWQQLEVFDAKVFQVAGSTDIYPRFTRLGVSSHSGTLILLDDISMLDQQAQQLKMSALGRLTGSIAHEIRNPLGAVSHAAQLLEESSNLDQADARLVQIIRVQSVRMNHIIENIMQLSRRDKVEQQRIQLQSWVSDFVTEFSRMLDVDHTAIKINISPQDSMVMMDVIHLYQIMFNLCQNGILHSQSEDAVLLEINGGEVTDSHALFLEVIDHGPGIDTSLVKQIFEPFFTTANKGTGLGLYIARELAEANQAHLSYLPQVNGGSCFRLTFKQQRKGFS